MDDLSALTIIAAALQSSVAATLAVLWFKAKNHSERLAKLETKMSKLRRILAAKFGDSNV